jgi:hypothetical protein
MILKRDVDLLKKFGKKAIALLALITTLIAVISVIAALAITKDIAGKFFGGRAELKYFREFVDNINSMKEPGSAPYSIALSKGSAIIGIAKNKPGFICHNCKRAVLIGMTKLTGDFRFARPDNEECAIENSCICLCRNSKAEKNDEIACSKIICEELNFDIIEKITISKDKGIYWENGFLYSRFNDRDTPFNGVYAGYQGRNTAAYYSKTLEVFIEKDIKNNIAVCPNEECSANPIPS